MTLFAMGPIVLDVPGHIACLLKPLQGRKFKCDEVAAQNIWRLLELYEHCRFDMPNLHRDQHIGGRGETYKRKNEAARLTLRAFNSVFVGADFARIKERLLGPTLCDACGVSCKIKLSPDEIAKGQKFFKHWYREAQELLPEAGD